jgi:hypothetical protein
MQVPSDRTEALARAARGELLGPMDIAAIWAIGRSRFNLLNQQGAFDLFKVKPAIGPRCFSGVKVHRYVQGESLEEPPTVFGRNRRQA